MSGHSSTVGEVSKGPGSTVQASLTLPGTPPTFTSPKPTPPTPTGIRATAPALGFHRQEGIQRDIPDPRNAKCNVCWGTMGAPEGPMNPAGNITALVFMSCSLLSETRGQGTLQARRRRSHTECPSSHVQCTRLYMANRGRNRTACLSYIRVPVWREVT